jgi:hypothetical protein
LTRKMPEIPGVVPQVPLQDGLRRTIERFRQGLMRTKKESALIYHAKSNHAEAWMRGIEGVDASS